MAATEVKFLGIPFSRFIFVDGTIEFFDKDGVMALTDSEYISELRKAQKAHGQIVELTAELLKQRAEADVPKDKAETKAFGQ